MRSSFVLLALLLPASSFSLSALGLEEACFEEAAARWKVPAAALRAVAKAETNGFHNVPDREDHSGHNHQRLYGVMGLRDDEALGHSLREAAAAAGLDPEKVIADPCANIQAAAALIAADLARGTTVESAIERSWGASNGGEAVGLYKARNLQAMKLTVRMAPEAGWCWRWWTNCDGQGQNPNPPGPGQEPDEPAQEAPRGDGGEFPGAEWDRSPNFDGGAIRARYIVLHSTEGNFNGAVSWLKNPKAKVSAHYVVRARDGYVKQLVRENDRAWHARCWNPQAIGIEMEGFIKDSASFTPALVRAASRIVKYLSAKHGIAADATRVVGHDASERGMLAGTGLEDCNDHGDPGKFFDWSGFWRLLGR